MGPDPPVNLPKAARLNGGERTCEMNSQHTNPNRCAVMLSPAVLERGRQELKQGLRAECLANLVRAERRNCGCAKPVKMVAEASVGYPQGTNS